jgi:hypothetical protein
MSITRAIKYPKVFKQSFYDRAEGVWFPTSVIGMATLLIGTMLFGIPKCGVSSFAFHGSVLMSAMASRSGGSLVLHLHLPSGNGSSQGPICSVRACLSTKVGI